LHCVGAVAAQAGDDPGGRVEDMIEGPMLANLPTARIGGMKAHCGVAVINTIKVSVFVNRILLVNTSMEMPTAGQSSGSLVAFVSLLCRAVLVSSSASFAVRTREERIVEPPVSLGPIAGLPRARVEQKDACEVRAQETCQSRSCIAPQLCNDRARPSLVHALTRKSHTLQAEVDDLS
jgi:hypothetical protein